MINIKQIIAGKWLQNCYVVSDSKANCFIIDPGDNAQEIIQYIKKNKLNLKAIINTHGHHDHIGTVSELKQYFKIPFFLNKLDIKILKSSNLFRNLFNGKNAVQIPEVDVDIARTKELKFGDIKIKVLETPGHSPGCVCFKIENYLFTGDILFKGKIGRVDLPGGDPNALCDSLKRLSKLPPETKIYPGHGEASTILEEKQTNCELKKAIQ